MLYWQPDEDPPLEGSTLSCTFLPQNIFTSPDAVALPRESKWVNLAAVAFSGFSPCRTKATSNTPVSNTSLSMNPWLSASQLVPPRPCCDACFSLAPDTRLARTVAISETQIRNSPAYFDILGEGREGSLGDTLKAVLGRITCSSCAPVDLSAVDPYNEYWTMRSNIPNLSLFQPSPPPPSKSLRNAEP